MNLEESYKRAFNFLEPKTSKNLDPHIKALQSMENGSALGMTFLFITNVTKQTYRFFTQSVEQCTGFKPEKFYQGGVPFVMSRVHPLDRSIWRLAIPEYASVIRLAAPGTRLKFILQFNYRFRHKHGNFIHISDQSIPIEMDDSGIPFLYFGHVNVLSNIENFKSKASICFLNKKNEYEVLKVIIPGGDAIKSQFTKRENEIINLVLKGDSSKEISEKLFISIHTVNTQRRRINIKVRDLQIEKNDLLKSYL